MSENAKESGDDGSVAAVTPSASDQLTVRELLEQPAMESAHLLAGASGQDTPFRRLNVMTVPEIVRWVEQGEFLLSTGFPLRAHGEPARLIRDLSEMGLAGLAVKFDTYLGSFGADVLAIADELGFPIVSVPIDTRFDDILSQAFETIINRQAAELNRSHRLHHTFLGLTFSGGGIQSLVEELAGMLDAEGAAFVDSSGTVLAQAGSIDAIHSPGPTPEAATFVDPGRLQEGLHSEEGTTWVVAPMLAASVVHGHVIVVDVDGHLGPYAKTAVQQAAIVGALEMMRDQAVRAVSGRFASNLLHELMTGDDLKGVSARAVALDWILSREVLVVAARPEDIREAPTAAAEQPQLREQLTAERWTAGCRRIDPHAAVGVLGAQLVAVLGAGSRNMRDAMSGLHAEMTSSTGRAFSFGVSGWHDGPAGVRGAYEEALRAMRLGPRVNGPHTVTHYGELGLFRLLAQLNKEELELFVSDTLGPIFALPDPERSDLLQTLDVLLANQLNIAQTARQIHYHYNTLRYRLTKLERLLGEFSSDAATARRIGVALEILRMHSLSSQ